MESTAEALAKAQKKLQKAQAAGDDELIAKFEKKIKKLQKKAEASDSGSPADKSEETTNSSKKRKKEQANGERMPGKIMTLQSSSTAVVLNFACKQ